MSTTMAELDAARAYVEILPVPQLPSIPSLYFVKVNINLQKADRFLLKFF